MLFGHRFIDSALVCAGRWGGERKRFGPAARGIGRRGCRDKKKKTITIAAKTKPRRGGAKNYKKKKKIQVFSVYCYYYYQSPAGREYASRTYYRVHRPHAANLPLRSWPYLSMFVRTILLLLCIILNGFFAFFCLFVFLSDRRKRFRAVTQLRKKFILHDVVRPGTRGTEMGTKKKCHTLRR